MDGVNNCTSSSDGDTESSESTPIQFAQDTPQYRVKLYQLESAGNWLDQGTGFVTCGTNDLNTNDPSKLEYCMSIRREVDYGIMLQTKIVFEDVYERQGESIIMWREKSEEWGLDVDYAISFQDSGGCYAVWDYICSVRNSLTQDISMYRPSGTSDNLIDQAIDYHNIADSHGTVAADGIDYIATNSRRGMLGYGELPAVSEHTVPDIIDKLVSASTNMPLKRHFAQFIVHSRGDYIKDLLTVSKKCASSGSVSTCNKISDILKSIVYLNDANIVNFMVSDEVFLDVAEALEYDSALKTYIRGGYRDFLSSDRATPRRALSHSFAAGDEIVFGACQRLFRLKFMRDVMLRPLIDESGSAAISNAITNTTADVCEMVFFDQTYLTILLQKIDTGSLSGTNFRLEQSVDIDNINASKDIVDVSTISSADYNDCESESKPLKIITGNRNIEQTYIKVAFYNTEVDCKSSVPSSKNEISDNSGLNQSTGSSKEGPRFAEIGSRTVCLNFLRELFSLSKVLTPDKRLELYSKFIHGTTSTLFFSALLAVMKRGPTIEWIRSRKCSTASVDELRLQELRDQETHHRLCAVDILAAFSSIFPSALRVYVIEGPSPKPRIMGVSLGGLGIAEQSSHRIKHTSHSNGLSNDAEENLYSVPSQYIMSHSSLEAMRIHNSKCILYVLLCRLTAESSSMVMEHISDIFRSLLDPDGRVESPLERERFAVLINDFYCSWLIAPFVEANAEIKPTITTSIKIPQFYTSSSIYYASTRIICDILCLCVVSLDYRMKYFIVRNNLANKVLVSLFQSNHRLVFLGGIKFISAVVKSKDDMNFRQWFKADALKPLFTLFKSFSSRDSLIVSAVLELIEFIRIENIKILVEYIATKHSDSFTDVVNGNEVFEKLMLRYNQNIDSEIPGANRGIVVGITSSGTDGYPQVLRQSIEVSRRQRVDSEESYFNEEDDEEMGPQIMSESFSSGTPSKDTNLTLASSSLRMLQEYGDDDTDDPKIIQMDKNEIHHETFDTTQHYVFGDEDNISLSGSGRPKKRRLSSMSTVSELKVLECTDKIDIFSGVGRHSAEFPNNDASNQTENGGALSSSKLDLQNEDGFNILPPLRSKFSNDSDSDDDDSSDSKSKKDILNNLFRRNIGRTSVAPNSVTSDKSSVESSKTIELNSAEEVI